MDRGPEAAQGCRARRAAPRSPRSSSSSGPRRHRRGPVATATSTRPPRSWTSEDTSVERTMKVSSRTPNAIATPISVNGTSGGTRASAANVPASTMPAEVMTEPVAPGAPQHPLARAVLLGLLAGAREQEDVVVGAQRHEEDEKDQHGQRRAQARIAEGPGERSRRRAQRRAERQHDRGDQQQRQHERAQHDREDREHDHDHQRRDQQVVGVPRRCAGRAAGPKTATRRGQPAPASASASARRSRICSIAWRACSRVQDRASAPPGPAGRRTARVAASGSTRARRATASWAQRAVRTWSRSSPGGGTTTWTGAVDPAGNGALQEPLGGDHRLRLVEAELLTAPRQARCRAASVRRQAPGQASPRPPAEMRGPRAARHPLAEAAPEATLGRHVLGIARAGGRRARTPAGRRWSAAPAAASAWPASRWPRTGRRRSGPVPAVALTRATSSTSSAAMTISAARGSGGERGAGQRDAHRLGVGRFVLAQLVAVAGDEQQRVVGAGPEASTSRMPALWLLTVTPGKLGQQVAQPARGQLGAADSGQRDDPEDGAAVDQDQQHEHQRGGDDEQRPADPAEGVLQDRLSTPAGPPTATCRPARWSRVGRRGRAAPAPGRRARPSRRSGGSGRSRAAPSRPGSGVHPSRR